MQEVRRTKNSGTGNRTPSCRAPMLRGGNVSRYTIPDLHFTGQTSTLLRTRHVHSKIPVHFTRCTSPFQQPSNGLRYFPRSSLSWYLLTDPSSMIRPSPGVRIWPSFSFFLPPTQSQPSLFLGFWVTACITVICILFCTTRFSWGLFGCVATDILGLISAWFQTPDLWLTKYVKLQHNQIVLTKIGCAKQYANHCSDPNRAIGGSRHHTIAFING